MSDENKKFQALLNGQIRHDFFSDTEMSDSFLKQELFPSLSDDAFTQMSSKSRQLLKART